MFSSFDGPLVRSSPVSLLCHPFSSSQSLLLPLHPFDMPPPLLFSLFLFPPPLPPPPPSSSFPSIPPPPPSYYTFTPQTRYPIPSLLLTPLSHSHRLNRPSVPPPPFSPPRPSLPPLPLKIHPPSPLLLLSLTNTPFVYGCPPPVSLVQPPFSFHM